MNPENLSGSAKENGGVETAGVSREAGNVRLGNLSPSPGAVKKRKRVGAGRGSGHGKTCGRGHKGQRAHSSRPRFGFEGGQMPLVRRIPKRGFKNIGAREYQIVNVGRLGVFSQGGEVGPEEMVARGFLKNGKKPVKILGVGDLSKALTVRAHGFSRKAAEKIEAAGGRVIKC